MKKKILAMCLVVALLATAVVGATLAYFTDTKAVENTFTVGDIDIKLDETVVEDGDATNERTELGNEYHLFPGQTYVKDPTVTVEEGSEECYVRMIVTISNQKALDEVFAPGIKLYEILTGYDASEWVLQKETEDGDNRIYEFWYKDAVDARAGAVELPALFKAIKIPENLDNAAMKKAFDGLKIDIEAHAMQKEGFATAADAWAKFPTT